MTSPPRPSALSVDDVCTLLKNAGLHFDYATAIRENAIDGSALLLLNDEDLRQDIGVAALGDRKKLANLISGLRELDKEQTIAATLSTVANSTPKSMPVSSALSSALSSAPSSPPSMFSISPPTHAFAAPAVSPNITKMANELPTMVPEKQNSKEALEDILGNTRMIDDLAKAFRSGQRAGESAQDVKGGAFSSIIHPPSKNETARHRSLCSVPARESWLPFGNDKPYYSEPKSVPAVVAEAPVRESFDDFCFQPVESEQSWNTEDVWSGVQNPHTQQQQAFTPTSEEEHEEFWPSVAADAEATMETMASASSGKTWASVAMVSTNTTKTKAPTAPAPKQEEKKSQKKTEQTAKAQHTTIAANKKPQAKNDEKTAKMDEATTNTTAKTTAKTQQKKASPSPQPQNQKAENAEKNDKTKKNAAVAKKEKEPQEELWTTVDRTREAPKGLKAKLPANCHLSPPFVVWVGGVGIFDLPKQPTFSQGSRLVREELTKICSTVGSLLEVAVVASMRNPETVGSAFVTFASANGALRCISELQGKKLPGMRSCSLRVEIPGNKWVRQSFQQYGQCC